MLNVNVPDYAFKWNELLKVQLLSRVRLLTSEEPSSCDSEVGARVEEFRSILLLRPFPFTALRFVVFVLFIVNSRTLATMNFTAEKPEAVELNTSHWRQLESLKRHGQCQSHPALSQHKRVKRSKRRIHFSAHMSLKRQDLKCCQKKGGGDIKQRTMFEDSHSRGREVVLFASSGGK